MYGAKHITVPTFPNLADLFFNRDESTASDKQNQGKFLQKNFKDYRKGFVAGRLASTNITNTTTTTTTSCIAMFPNCSSGTSVAPMLDFTILQYWQKLSNYIPLTITV